MTSTSVTKIGGVVVVTQVIPQDEASIPLESTAALATQAPPPANPPPPTPPTKGDDMTAAFLRGEPQGLGVVQIVIGLLCILFSLTAAYSPILIAHAPLCLAVAFVVSGSVSLAAVRRTTVALVWNSLVWNLISVVFGLAGVAYVGWLLADDPPSERLCRAETSGGVVPTDAETDRCLRQLWILNVSVFGPLGLLLVLLVLQVCVSITVCVFSGRALRRCDRDSPLTVVADDSRALLGASAQRHGSDDALLDSD